MIRPCPHCRKKNRVSERDLTHTGRCGACKGELPAVQSPLGVDAATFAAIQAQTREPVLVDFWAPWCGPCRAATPVLEKIAKDFGGRALVVKVNTDENPQLAAKYGVRGIPHFMVMKEGEVHSSHVGLESESAMRGWLTAAGA